MKNTSYIAQILFAVTVSVIGQVLIKKGLNLLGKIDLSSKPLAGYMKMFNSPLVLIGCFIYFVATIFWLYIMSKVDLTFAYPFLAFSYVLIMIASWVFLGESIPLVRWLGVSAICFGVFLISRS